MKIIALITALFALGTGGAVLWANPRRFTNQAFALISLLLVAELAFIFAAAAAGQKLLMGGAADPVIWIRCNAAVIGFFPWALWLTKEAIATSGSRKRETVLRSWPWLILALGMAMICFTDSFIPPDSRQESPERGIAYIVRGVCLISALCILMYSSAKQARSLTGIRGVEMRFLVLNGGTIAILSVGLVSVGTFISSQELKGLAVAVTLIGYSTMVWAITVHRIFDAKQIFVSVGQRLITVVVVVIATIGLVNLWNSALWYMLSLCFGACFGGFVAYHLDRATRKWLGIGDKQVLQTVRAEVLKLAAEARADENLVQDFEVLLEKECKTASVRLFYDPLNNPSELGIDEAAMNALGGNGWATPESLDRQGGSLELDALRSCLLKAAIGLVITVPAGINRPSLLIVFGAKNNHWPYTYPEVERLQNLAELMDNILTHSRLVAQAALKAKIEYLALVSRGLAHDLKNLITPMSSFLVHTEGYFPPGSAAEEVRLAAKRATRIMSEYVREAWFFGNQLEPKFEPVSMGEVMAAVHQVTETHAKRREVKVEVVSAADATLVADAVLIQRLLTNLVANAIDASTAGSTVRMEASRVPADRLRVRVSDQGCGIAPEHRERIFEPYFTTKVFGDDTRGFGLGLTICQKIVQLHEGAITVQSEMNTGTTFAVDLPLRRFLPRAALPATGSGRARVSRGVVLA